MRTFSQMLLEMSFEAKQQVMEKIRDLSYPINEHLMKLYMFPNSKDKDHWKKEIRTWINQIYKMNVKPKNKKLSKETYFKILYDEPLEGMDDHTKKHFINSIIQDYPNEFTSIKVKDFNEMNDMFTYVF